MRKTTYRTGRESPASLHAKPPVTFAQGQTRALAAMLARCYGPGAKVDPETVAAWAALVDAWPAVGEQDQPLSRSNLSPSR